ncbi:MAG: hypothetical protein R2725_05980 [Solirubrobacterales bacterium]
MTSVETPFAVEAALRRHFHRETTGSQFGATLWQLVRSDQDRLVYFDGGRVIEDYDVQRRYVVGADERVAIEAHQSDPSLTPVFGWVLSDPQIRPEQAAWLVSDDGDLLDPARSRRPFVGGLGVVLRATEIAAWTPDTVYAVALR